MRGALPLRVSKRAYRTYWCTQPSRLIHVCEYEKCFPCEKKARKHTTEKGSARSLDWHHFPKIDPKIALQTLPGGQRRAPQAKRSPRTCPAGPCRPRVGIALLRAPNLARVAADRDGRSGSGWTHWLEPAFCCPVGGRALAWPVAPRLAQAAAAARARAALAPSPPSGRRERRWERRRERRREAERWRRPREKPAGA